MLSLSNELLLALFAACPDIRTALSLASADRRLRGIWLEHSDIIIEELLRPTIPAYDEAVRLARGELRLEQLNFDKADQTEQQNTHTPDFPVRACLPKLSRNAELCASAHGACAAFINPPNSARNFARTYASSPSSYYFLRRLVLGYELLEWRRPLLEEITAMSLDTIRKHTEFILFFFSYMDVQEAYKQGAGEEVVERRCPDPLDLDLDDDIVLGGWDYACNVMIVARDDKCRGKNGLAQEMGLRPTMNLLVLSNELLVAIFTACDLGSALKLATVNHQLHRIWIEHAGVILDRILPSTIPAYAEAQMLARAQLQLEQPPEGSPSDVAPKEDAAGGGSLLACLPILLRNADLSASALAACDEQFKEPDAVQFPLSPHSYYFIRRIVLAFDLPSTRDVLFKELTSMPVEQIREHWDLVQCLYFDADIDEADRQGMSNVDRRRWPNMQDDYDTVYTFDGWDYALDVLTFAKDDKIFGMNTLPDVMQGKSLRR